MPSRAPLGQAINPAIACAGFVLGISSCAPSRTASASSSSGAAVRLDRSRAEASSAVKIQ